MDYVARTLQNIDGCVLDTSKLCIFRESATIWESPSNIGFGLYEYLSSMSGEWYFDTFTLMVL